MNENAYILFEAADRLGFRFIIASFGNDNKPKITEKEYESYNDIQKIEFWDSLLKGEIAGGVFND